MISSAEAKQFRLTDEGRILFQPDPTNPLPGNPVGSVIRGSSILAPVAVLDDGVAGAEDAAAATAKLQDWLNGHIRTTLEALFNLENTDGLAEPVAGICSAVRDAFGILPRSDVESFIKNLDPDMRRVLREKNIRLGPVLVFMPVLNKPAAVRLRALLWTLWNERNLPATVPADGIVSMVAPEGADPVYFRAIGYPIYGRRAIRIDMLDRVISAVYDGAQNGQFRAKHEMAEWLGCPIADLYAALEAMGHTKISDPADSPPMDSPPADAAPVANEASAPIQALETEQQPAAPAVPPPKPELALFRLRRGKAHESLAPERRFHRRHRDKPPAGEKVKNFGEQRGPKKREKHHRRKRDEGDGKPRLFYAAAPQPDQEDSPFAMLRDLKTRSSGE